MRAECGNGEYSYWTSAVTFTTDPYCTDASNVQATQVQGTSALITWASAPVGATGYTVGYSEAGLDNWTIIPSVTGNSYMLSGLDPSTAYDVFVLSECDMGDADSVFATFTTNCLVGGDLAIGNGTTTSTYIPSYSTYENAFSQQIFTAAEMGGAAEISSISLYMTAVSQQRHLKFYLMHTTSANLSSGWLPTDSAVLVYNAPHNYVTGWNTFNFSTPFSYDGVRNLVLIAIDSNDSWTGGNTWRTHSAFSGSARYVYQDNTQYPISPVPSSAGTVLSTRNNIIFGVPCDSTTVCAAPNVYVYDYTDESVTLDWAPGYTETSWEMEYSEDATNWTSEGTVSTYPYTIVNLTANTSYYIRLRAVCGGGDYSDWTTVHVTTPCTSITLPYIEHFDTSTGSGAGNMVSCWNTITNSSTSYPYTSSSYAHSGSYSVYFYGTTAYNSYLVSPRIEDNAQMNNLQVRFYAYKTSAAYAIEVGVMSNPEDINTFVTLGQFSPSATSTWEYFDVNTTYYTGSGRYIAFRMPGTVTSYMYLDDVEIDYIPDCDHVSNISALGATITTNSATLTWTPGGDETEWEVVYGIAGTINDPNVETPVQVYGSPSVDLTGLSASSDYDVYVRAICSGSETSAWMFASFMTACGEITTLPYTQNFDNMGSGSAAYPNCWNRYNTYSTSTNYPYVSTSYHQSGNASLYFYSSSSTYNLAILPPVDTNALPINTLMISFAMRATSGVTSKIIVGVMDSPTNYNSFTPVDTVSNTTTGVFEDMEVSFASFTGSGAYIALKLINTSGTYSIYLDDLLLEEIPECPKPTQVTATSMGDTIMLSWTDPSGTATSWDVIYGPTGFDPDTSSTATIELGVYDNPYYIADLPSGVVYDFYVRTNCASGDISPWCTTPGSAAPNMFAMGITGSASITGCGWTITDDGGMNGSYSNNCNYTLVVYPSDPDSVVVISGTFAGESSLDYLSIYDGTAVDANFLIQKIYSSMNGGSSGNVINFGPFTSETGPLTLLFHSDGSVVYPGFVANTSCAAAPSCPKPYDVTALNVATNSVELSWTQGGSATSWVIEYGPTGFTPGGTQGNIEYATTNPFTITGLASATAYDFYITADCGGGETSATSNVYSVTTPCNAIDSLPFTEGFDTYGTGTTVYVPCWGKINTYTSGDRPYVNSTHYAGTGSLYFYAASGTYNIAVTPPFDALIPVNTLQATFMYRASSTTDYMIVGVMTNPSDASSFVPIDTVYPASTASTWVEKEVLFNGYTGTGQYIAFYNGKASTTCYSYIDNLVIDLIPACPKPTQVHVASTTNSSIELGWTENGSATSWVIEYGPVGFTVGSGTTETATTNPYTISNLTASTQYDFYIKSDCGAGEYSNNTSALTAATECDAVDQLPYTENFDTYGTGTTAYPLCWGKINTYSADRPYVNSTNYAGVGSLYFYATSGTYNIAITPQFDATIPVNTLQATFMYRASSTSDYMIVGVMTNPSNASTFVPVDTVYPASTASTWVEKEVVFSDYTGSGQYIAFYNGKASATCYSYMDNLFIEEIPTCPKPHNVSVTATTENSATVTWTPTGSETSWEIAYGPSGFDPNGTSATVVATPTNPYTVQNLTPATPYEFYVRAICSASDQSLWSAQAGTGVTQCSGTVALPYTEDFESYTGTTYSDNNGVAPACWTTYSTNTTYGAPHITSSGSYHYVHSGTNCMVFTCGSAGADAYAALPTFNQPLNTLTLNFWRAMESTTNGSTLTVGYVTDLNNMDSTFVTVATIPSVSSTAGDTISVNFATSGVPANGNICFHWNYNSSFYSCCIDDVQVTSGGSGPVVNDPTVATNDATAIAETSATLNATITNPDNVTITAKGFEWKTTTGGTYAQVTGTGTGNNFTYNLTGLTPNTSYTFKAFITFNGTTVYGSEKTFTTLDQGVEPCNVPTGLTASDIQGESITISWNNDPAVSSWNIQYRPEGGQLSTASSTTNSYTITGLTNNTTYQIQVQANCGDGNLSDWTQAISVTTTGIASWLENSVSLYPNPAKEYVDIRVDGDLNVTTMEVYDVYGKLLNTVNVVDNPTRINVSSLADGMYFVRVTTEKGTVTKSFVKK